MFLIPNVVILYELMNIILDGQASVGFIIVNSQS